MRSATSGNAGEAAVLNAFVKRGYLALVPFGDGHPYDLVVDLEATVGPSHLRVQCKTAWTNGACVTFNTRGTDHGNGRRSYAGLADMFGVYYPPLDSVYLAPIDAVASFAGCLRLEPTRNNQRRGVRFAADYEIDRWSREDLLGVCRRARSSSTASQVA